MVRRARARLTLSVLAGLTLTACGAAPIPSPLPSLNTASPTATMSATILIETTPPTAPSASPKSPAPQIERAPPPSAPIRTFDTSGPFACAGVGLLDATLQGDPNDPRVAWIAVTGHGARGVIFPKGFTARFAPKLEILDSTGLVRFRAGDSIDGGCVWGQQDVLIGWP